MELYDRLACPQHAIVFSLRWALVIQCRAWLGARHGGALQKDRATRQPRPEQDDIPPARSQANRNRESDPDAQTVKAIEELSPEAVAGSPPQAGHQLPRAIFGLE